MKSAINHLKSDPALYPVIQKFGKIEYEPTSDLFSSLVGSIIEQQLSGKAAATIYNRFLDLFPNKTYNANLILTTPLEKIRAVGTSWAKARSLHDLSQKVLDGTLQLSKLSDMTDEEVINHLIQVKGIGRWSAEMRLMFSLGRMDILPLADVGIQNAMVKLYGLNRNHKSLYKQMTKIALPWRPYRTVACWYLWKYLDNR